MTATENTPPRRGRILSRVAGALCMLLGLLGLAGGGLWLSDFYAKEAVKRATLAAPLPALTALEHLDRAALRPPAEAHVTGQMAPDSLLIRPSDHTRWIAPLYGVAAQDAEEGPIAWIVHSGAIWEETPLHSVGEGAIGPVVEILGRIVPPEDHAVALEKARGGADPSVLVIEPYAGPRALALAPREPDWPRWAVFMLAAIGVVVYGAALWWKG